MLHSPKVSIIIPCYNVSESLPYCLDSILAQSFKDYEALFIDDGSTDNTGDLLDRAAAANERVRVMHKPNGGLSDARNCGIENAQGDYLTFIDGDDVVSPRYLEAMVKAQSMSPSSCVACACQLVWHKTALRREETWNATTTFRLLTQDNALESVVLGEMPDSACGKLVARCVYSSDFFPFGQYREDLATIDKLIDAHKEFVLVMEPLYGYVQRDGSMVRSGATSITKAMDYYDAIERFEKWASSNYPDVGAVLSFKISLEAMRLHELLGRVVDDKALALEMDRWCRFYVKAHLTACLEMDAVSVANKIRLALFAASPTVHDVVLAGHSIARRYF